MALVFRDRRDAGQTLATHLHAYADTPDVIVLGLPRGGVPVAAEVAAALHAPLDAFLVRKLGVPGHEELAMGAIASGGVRVLNEEIVSGLQIPEAVLNATEAVERRELARRERVYRGDRGSLDLAGKTVILVDDGLATGSSMRAAVEAVRQEFPARIVVAVPVGAESVCASMRELADDVICAATPDPLHAVGIWYEDFQPTSDEEVQEAMRTNPASPATTPVTRSPADLSSPAASSIRAAATPLAGEADLDRVLDLIGNAQVVLIGEASHGTDEFYRTRAALTRRLIAERGFTAVAVEADWPDALRVNRYVRGQGTDASSDEALSEFRRFPRWMWRNTVVQEFVEWLREHNQHATTPAGFYGLDLYSLHTSIESVLRLPGQGGSGECDASACPVQLLRSLRGRSPGVRLCHRRRHHGAVRGRGGRATGGAAAGGGDGWLRRARTATRRSSRSRMRVWCATPSRTTGPCLPGVCPHGICGTGTWRKRWRRCAPICGKNPRREGRGLGAQFAPG